jgi:hypothetical protein
LYHAGLAFSVSGMLLRSLGLPLPLAFLSVVVAILVDLDRTLSPSVRHDRFLHSPYLLLILPISTVLAGLTGEGTVLFLPALGALCHILLDGLSGEEVRLVDERFRLVAFQFRWRDPRKARLVCWAGLLCCPLPLFI